MIPDTAAVFKGRRWLMRADGVEAANVDHLVTGNLRHFPARSRQGVSVLKPTQFLERF